ncbi:hypothetical protein LOTGIDRAFT_174003 [Lottia gigantea]|uniref:Uncharacterized protein n=1 Tax=Lottia gigantea TaxID=225164 RepID=V4A525_LOTGI|nr:hypothetical protein LOTGIDRAFT_174003 [Lottia gigantea]ESO99003.1 hypothetical protein LOTGIDRAFT_174003 [Lottia gigantea]
MDIKLFIVDFFLIVCLGLSVAQNNARDYYMMNARLRQQPNGARLVSVDQPLPPPAPKKTPSYNPHVVRVDPQPAAYPAPSGQPLPTVVYAQNQPSGPPQRSVVYAQSGASRPAAYVQRGPTNVVYAQRGPPTSNIVYAQSGPPAQSVVYAQNPQNAQPRSKVYYSPSTQNEPPRTSDPYRSVVYAQPQSPARHGPVHTHVIAAPTGHHAPESHIAHPQAPRVIYAQRAQAGQPQNTRVVYVSPTAQSPNTPPGQTPKVVHSPSPRVIYAQNPPIVYDPNPRPLSSPQVVYAQSPRVVYAQSPPVVYAQPPQVVYVRSPQAVYAQSPGHKKVVMLTPGTHKRSPTNITHQSPQPQNQHSQHNPVLNNPVPQGVGTTPNPLVGLGPYGFEVPKPRLVSGQNTVWITTTPSNNYVSPTTIANFDAYARIMNSSLPKAEGLPAYCRVDPRSRGLFCVIPNGDTMQYDVLRQWSVNTGLNKSVYITCMPGGSFALSWPMRAMNIVNLHVRNCAMIDFFKYMGTSSVIPDKLQSLEIYNSMVNIKLAELAVLIKRSNQLRSAFSTTDDCGQKTLKKYVFKDMKFEVFSQNLTFSQYSKVRRFLDKFLQMAKLQTCTYPNLIHLDESGSPLSSLYYHQLVTTNAVFPKLKTYLSSGIGLTEIPKELSSFPKHFPCMVYLDLSNNLITAAKFNLEFRGECLTPSTDPVYINLRNNRIAMLPTMQIEFLLDSRIIVDLQGNPINCAVQSNTLRQYAMDMATAFPKYAAILNATPCFSPKEIAKAMPPLPPVPGMPLPADATSVVPGLPESIVPPMPPGLPPGISPLSPGIPATDPGLPPLPPGMAGLSGLPMDMSFIPGMPMPPVPGMPVYDLIPHPFGHPHPVPPPSLAV